jgi:hypothetical protein
MQPAEETTMATFERDHDTRGRDARDTTPDGHDTHDPHTTLYGQSVVGPKVTQGRYAPAEMRGQDGYTTSAVATSAVATMPAPPQWVGAAMPWVISLFFHLGVAMILAFAMIITVVTPPPPIEAPVVQNPMAPQRDGPVVPQATVIPDATNSNPVNNPDRLRQFHEDSLRNLTNHDIIVKTGEPGPITALLPTGSAGLNPTQSSGRGMFEQGIVGGQGRAGSFRPQGGLSRVSNMIFVIDRSGSMISDLGPLKHELMKTVRQLKPEQRFALVLFTSGEPREFEPGRLVQADEAAKRQFFDYVNALEAAGRTDPMPALRRAFALAKAAPKTQYTAICLLTDGVFPDADAAIAYVAQATRDTNIHVFTYLYGQQNKEAEIMMKRIAHEGNGSYNSVTRE